MTRKSNLCHRSLSPLFILGLFSELLNGSTPLVLFGNPHDLAVRDTWLAACCMSLASKFRLHVLLKRHAANPYHSEAFT
jgi:hypothetical protein